MNMSTLKDQIKEATATELVQIITGEPRMLMDQAGDGGGITESIEDIITELNGRGDGQIDTVCSWTESNGLNIIRPNHNPGGSPNG